MTDPERWSEHSLELTSAERRALAAGRRGPDVPEAAQRAVWAGLATTLAASSAAAVTGSGTTGLTVAALVKQLAFGMLLGVAVTGGAAVYERASRPSPTPSVTPASGRPPAAPSRILPSEAPAVRIPSVALPAGGSGATLEHAPSSSRPVSVPSAREAFVPYGSGQASFPTPGSSTSESAESRRLIAARALLRSGRPSAALDALASIRADFPAGALAQEREALAIEALLASGARAAARARAVAFLAQYPESPHADSVRKALR